MHQGRELYKFLKAKDISVKKAAEILGKKRPQSIYKYFKSERFSQPVRDELQAKLGFFLDEQTLEDQVQALQSKLEERERLLKQLLNLNEKLEKDNKKLRNELEEQ